MDKSITQQIKDGKGPYGSMSEVTEKQITQVLSDIMGTARKPKPMVFIMGCLDRGAVTQSNEDVKLCKNPNCKNCRNLEKALKEQCK